MSYILDALRRADAERERGSIPDLRAQPLGAPSAQEMPRPLPWPWIAAVLAALLVGALAWYLAAPDEPQVPTAAVPAASDGATATTPGAATRAANADAAMPAPPRPGATASPAAAEPRPLKPSVTVVATAPPRAASMPAKGEPAASDAGARVYAQAELPPDIRRQLPPLAIGGSMYSENAANRMLIVNGQLFHENEKPAPEVTLEKIKLKSAILKFRDYRFEVSY
jgi:general secretion pathway protein B